MTSVAALVVAILLIIALGSLIAVLVGVPILAIIIGAAVVAMIAFYLLTNALQSKAARANVTTSSGNPGPNEKDHIS
jgi:hypothetical protein